MSIGVLEAMCFHQNLAPPHLNQYSVGEEPVSTDSPALWFVLLQEWNSDENPKIILSRVFSPTGWKEMFETQLGWNQLQR